MSDRLRVEEAAKRLHEEELGAQAEAGRVWAGRVSREVSALTALKTRLDAFADDLRGRVVLQVRLNAPGGWPSLTLAISSAPLWVRRPYRLYRIFAKPSWDEADITVCYAVHRVIPAPLTGDANDIEDCAQRSLDTDGSPQTLDALISGLDVVCATLINQSEGVAYRLPDWYLAAGRALAWPLSALTLLAFLFLSTWSGTWAFLL